ncbi:MAG: hypothetical protein ACSHXF_15965 [Aquaticitalea sp.]
MVLKLSKIILLFFMLLSVAGIAQTQDEAEKQRQEYEEKAQEQLEKITQGFISDLKVDDFQKEIIKQKIYSYFEERKKLFLDPSLRYFERDEKLNLLTESHFSDIQNLISDETMDKIQSFVKDGGEELKKEKKKDKRKNRKKKD